MAGKNRLCLPSLLPFSRSHSFVVSTVQSASQPARVVSSFSRHTFPFFALFCLMQTPLSSSCPFFFYNFLFLLYIFCACSNLPSFFLSFPYSFFLFSFFIKLAPWHQRESSHSAGRQAVWPDRPPFYHLACPQTPATSGHSTSQSTTPPSRGEGEVTTNVLLNEVERKLRPRQLQLRSQCGQILPTLAGLSEVRKSILTALFKATISCLSLLLKNGNNNNCKGEWMDRTVNRLRETLKVEKGAIQL